MKLKGLVDEDIANYKKTSMFLVTSKCSMKCNQENGKSICQNGTLLVQPDIDIDAEKIYTRYISNPLTSALVIGGLEPFDTFEDLKDLLCCFRQTHQVKDDIVIYTGYTEQEAQSRLKELEDYYPLIIKFGRYRPTQQPHYDEILGVELQNTEQYAKIFAK